MDIIIRFLYEDALGEYNLESVYLELTAPNTSRTPDGERYKCFLEKYLNGRQPAINKNDLRAEDKR